MKAEELVKLLQKSKSKKVIIEAGYNDFTVREVEETEKEIRIKLWKV